MGALDGVQGKKKGYLWLGLAARKMRKERGFEDFGLGAHFTKIVYLSWPRNSRIWISKASM